MKLDITKTYLLFSNILLKWYIDNKRDLPWRNTQSPYLVWLSEVILQQTRVAQGLPYYIAFSTQYPTVQLLADAPQADVMRLWQGLGYYSRARNMHNTAKAVVEQFGGVFPDNYHSLLTLKGVGPYTAAAIASFCYQEKIAVVDGNVYRVLSRIFGEVADISSSLGKKKFQLLANTLIENSQPDLHNQAIMEFGALQCTPKNFLCDSCPFAGICVAKLSDSQSVLPVKLKKVKVKHRFLNYLVFAKNNKLFLKQRNDSDIWGSLFDFYLVETTQEVGLTEILEDDFINSLKTNVLSIEEPVFFQHILTHQRIKASFYVVHLTKKFVEQDLKNGRFYTISEIEELAKPVLISKFLTRYFT